MKKKVTTILIFVLSALLMFALVGCTDTTKEEETSAPATNEESATTEETTGEETADTMTYKISLIPQTLNNPFFVAMQDGCEQAVEDFKAEGIEIELSVQAPQEETDAEAQLQLVENAITAGADCIMFPAINPDGLIPGVLKANEAGVLIINIDSGLNFESLEEQGGEIVCYIGSDNVEGGMIAGKAMGEYFKDEDGPVEVCVVEGLPGHVNAEARKKGFNEGVAEYDNIEVVASQAANWSMDEAYTVMQNMLQANPDIKGVFTCSDQMGIGAINAIDAAGKTGEIVVFSFDATEAGLQEVEAGTMFGTVAQYPVEMGYRGVEIAIDVLTNDAQIDDKIWTTVKLITKDNLDDVG